VKWWEKAMRVGLFGGTFDPVHQGHLILAEQCREACALDKVLFVVAGEPPHKGRPKTAAKLSLQGPVHTILTKHWNKSPPKGLATNSFSLSGPTAWSICPAGEDPNAFLNWPRLSSSIVRAPIQRFWKNSSRRLSIEESYR
jgi:cytidyltransferase-like protein